MRTVITDTEKAVMYGTASGRIQVELEKFEPWERGHILLSLLLSMTVAEHMDQAERHEKAAAIPPPAPPAAVVPSDAAVLLAEDCIDYLAAMMKEHADAAFLLGQSETGGTH